MPFYWKPSRSSSHQSNSSRSRSHRQQPQVRSRLLSWRLQTRSNVEDGPPPSAHSNSWVRHGNICFQCSASGKFLRLSASNRPGFLAFLLKTSPATKSLASGKYQGVFPIEKPDWKKRTAASEPQTRLLPPRGRLGLEPSRTFCRTFCRTPSPRVPSALQPEDSSSFSGTWWFEL